MLWISFTEIIYLVVLILFSIPEESPNDPPLYFILSQNIHIFESAADLFAAELPEPSYSVALPNPVSNTSTYEHSHTKIIASGLTSDPSDNTTANGRS
jgi:hypothetical protein